MSSYYSILLSEIRSKKSQIVDPKRIAQNIFTGLVSIVIAVFLCFSIHSGVAIGADLTGPTGDERPPLPEQKPPDQPPSVTSPTQTDTEKKEILELPLERVFVRKIVVTGSTVFSADELAEVATPFSAIVRIVSVGRQPVPRRCGFELYVYR